MLSDVPCVVVVRSFLHPRGSCPNLSLARGSISDLVRVPRIVVLRFSWIRSTCLPWSGDVALSCGWATSKSVDSGGSFPSSVSSKDPSPTHPMSSFPWIQSQRDKERKTHPPSPDPYEYEYDADTDGNERMERDPTDEPRERNQVRRYMEVEDRRHQHVVVIGGGFAGRRAVRVLLNQGKGTTCTVVDEKGYFEFVPSNLRCLVEPQHAEKIVLPHRAPMHFRDRWSKWMNTWKSKKDPCPEPKEANQFDTNRVKFLQGKATHIDFQKREVCVCSTSTASDRTKEDTTVPYDYCIVCTGSTYANPIKGTGAGSQAALECRKEEIRQAARELAAATTVAVVGGGTVGVELAAEIAGAFPRQKQVTLISGSARLLSRMPLAAGKYAESWLAHRGVSLLLGQQVSKEEDSYLITTEGQKVHADVVYQCTGGQPVDELLQGQKTTLQEDGKMYHPFGTGDCKVNPFLQLESEGADGRVFVAGDCLPGGSFEKTAFMADLQATAAAQNILSCQSGKSMVPFPQSVCFGKTAAPRLAFVSLYKYSGIFQMNDNIIGGPLAALGKYVLEWLQLKTAQERILSHGIFSALEAASVFTAVTLFGKKEKAMPCGSSNVTDRPCLAAI